MKRSVRPELRAISGFFPACQILYLTNGGHVVFQGAPLLSGIADVPSFDREALIRVCRGLSTRSDQVAPTVSSSFWRRLPVGSQSTISHNGTR